MKEAALYSVTRKYGKQRLNRISKLFYYSHYEFCHSEIHSLIQLTYIRYLLNNLVDVAESQCGGESRYFINIQSRI